MIDNKRPCTCQLEIEDCFCEWDDEDFSKLRTKELSLLCEKMNQGHLRVALSSPKMPTKTVGISNLAKKFSEL